MIDSIYGKYMAWKIRRTYLFEFISVGSFKGPVVAQEHRKQPKNIVPKQFSVSKT